MSLLSSSLRAALSAARPSASRTTAPLVALTATSALSGRRTYASGDYGSGSGDPKGENPQAQGANPSADQEHPGPPPPSAGQGSGSTPTKGTSSGHNTGAAKQESSSSSSSSSSDSSSSATDKKQGAQPKILNEAPPKESEQSPDVKQHNNEMDHRAERANEKVSDEEAGKDNVPKSFWSGQGGVDRDP